jgi:hypothetical protein
MQAKTRSAPRTPSDWSRSIQSPTRLGSSRSTSPQSPTGASSGRGRQTRWTLVARAADSLRAGGEPFRGDGPGAGDGPAAADQAPIEERFPAFGGLVGEDDRAHAVLAQHAPALGEGLGHALLEERPILWPAVRVLLRLVLHRLARLGRERVRRIEGIAQQRMPRQRALEPDEEEVREVGVGNGVVVGRVGEPDLRRLVGQRVLGRVGLLDLAATRAGPGFDDLLTQSRRPRRNPVSEVGIDLDRNPRQSATLAAQMCVRLLQVRNATSRTVLSGPRTDSPPPPSPPAPPRRRRPAARARAAPASPAPPSAAP